MKQNKKKAKALAKQNKKNEKEKNKKVKKSKPKTKHGLFKSKKSKKESTNNNKKKTDVVRVAEKEYVYADVRLFRYMPIIFMLAILLIGGGYGYLGIQNHEYKVAQGKLAMPNNTQLPLFKGTSKGNLTLKSAILSANHKQMAVSIGYDQDAHSQLSSFGNRYKLWLIAPNGYPVQGIHLKYGFFGTDGNGVLQVNSDKPLPNEAFVVIIVDEGHLVTSEQINDGQSSYDDSDVNQSITAQLATGSAQDESDAASDSSSSSDKTMPPMYYVRLNPYSIKHTKINWGNNERELVENLIVRRNLRKLRNNIKKDKIELKQLKRTRQEYADRLKINPQDETATEGKNDLDNSIESLNQDIESQQANYDRVSKARFGKNILGKQQTKHHTLTTRNIQYFTNNGTRN